jgi:hypothetical protein
MGVKCMQGVPAHIEYIKGNPQTKRNVNCKFCKDEICNNTISIKYGERCCSKRGCMYSIPLFQSNEKVETIKKFTTKNNEFIRKSIYSIDGIINKYFSAELEEEIKIDNNSYKIKTSYYDKKDNLLLNILYKNRNHNFIFKYKLKLKDILKIEENKIVFKVNLDSLIKEISIADKKLGELIKKNNISYITRKAVIDNEEEIIKSRNSLIKFTSYIITRELLKLYN